MQYELYLDVVLVTDLVMNLMILYSTGRLLKSSIKPHKLLLAALTGSLAHGLILVAAIRNGAARLWMLSPIIAGVMIGISFSFHGIGVFIKRLLTFGAIAALLAGCMQALNPFQRKTIGVFVLATTASYIGLVAMYKGYRWFRRDQGNLFKVRIYMDSDPILVTGLLDTGNRLIDPYYHKPVHILEQKILGEISFEELTDRKLHMIPFHSVGKSQGLLPAIIIPKLVVEHPDGEKVIKGAVIALSKEQLSNHQGYQLILHEECIHD